MLFQHVVWMDTKNSLYRLFLKSFTKAVYLKAKKEILKQRYFLLFYSRKYLVKTKIGFFLFTFLFDWHQSIGLIFTHHVKYGQRKKEVVKYSVNSLTPECPNGNSIAYESNYAKDKDQQSFSDPLEVVKSHILQI